MSTPEPLRTPRSGASSIRAFLVQAGATMAAQVSLLAALLFYFGWKRNQAFSGYLGYSESQLNSSAQRYVLSSIAALFDPLLIVAGVALLWRIADPLLVRLSTDRERLRSRVCSGLVSCLVVVPVCTWAFLRLSPRWWELGLPASLTVGVLLACWAGALWARTQAGGENRPPTQDEDETEGQRAPGPAWLTWSASLAVYVLGLVVILLFWTAGTFAEIQGRGAAKSLVAHLGDTTSVTVFSDKDLRLYGAPGVRPTVFDSPGAYRYRYEGLKLVAYSDGKLFLIPSGWTFDHPEVIVLPEQAGIRVEYVYP
ncbi:hypothetical protein ABZ848_05610 [Streptomyces sp. NPDC047081]|uniref:hypothetical protein n=1 Tax=Streptomyces sp. NPDC047081 TaxID=3154706 RepID=UPI0033F842B3